MYNLRPFRLTPGLLVAGLALLVSYSKAQTTRVTQSGTVSGTMPQSLRVPTGLSFKVRLKEGLSSRIATPGTIWTGVLAEDFVSPQGRVYAVVGTTVTGVVATVQPAVNDQPASLSLRAMSIDGVEIYTDNRTRSGPGPSQGGDLLTSGSYNLRNDHAGTTGDSGGFATSGAKQQVNLAAGSLLTFSTSAP
ncbi:hypothetical protein H7849_25235 [Alloacidobacterium dinghuense]|uniref:Uncharacterized protein n=1 Tax=Alloacidobacterium dinghuense TaxID=2763107 RepID=A0A7G8BI79_9BACT|nr:hypothetical protein [Alloacidobacterium dinghuense]QNI32249.1 hypothetical protein H7849_25235 [Alloacidobacterium dinghuense]